MIRPKRCDHGNTQAQKKKNKGERPVFYVALLILLSLFDFTGCTGIVHLARKGKQQKEITNRALHIIFG